MGVCAVCGGKAASESSSRNIVLKVRNLSVFSTEDGSGSSQNTDSSRACTSFDTGSNELVSAIATDQLEVIAETLRQEDFNADTGRSLRRKSRKMSLRSQLIRQNAGHIEEVYDICKHEKLGEGTFGCVRRGTRRTTGVVRAIKAIPKKNMKDIPSVRQEIEIMKAMDHPTIIKLFETFEDGARINLVMELCDGGELFSRIIDAGRLTEREAAIVMQQILRAVFYMHEHDICHRDLKPENFLFLTKDPIAHNVLKLIDFGFSCHSNSDAVHKTLIGTSQYMAPEVLKRSYNRKCDLWSCGVILCTLLVGKLPFHGKSPQEIRAKVRRGTFSLNGIAWQNVSEYAKELFQLLLTKDPQARCSAEQALDHKWIKLTAPSALDPELDGSFIENFRVFQDHNKLKKVALHVIAGHLGEEQTKGLREIFTQLDIGRNGVLTSSELTHRFKDVFSVSSTPDLDRIISGVDSSGSGVIDYSEFLAATLDRQTYLNEDVCWHAFSVLDLDGDGRISQSDLSKMFRLGSRTEARFYSKELMRSLNPSGLDFEEFMTMMRTGADREDSSESSGSLASRVPKQQLTGPGLEFLDFD